MANAATTTASVTLENNTSDPIMHIDWYLDEQLVGSGEIVQLEVPLGSSKLQAVGMAMSGFETRDEISVSVVDSVAPEITTTTSRIKGSKTNKGTSFLSVNYGAIDVCDPSPLVEASIVLPIDSEEEIRIQRTQGKIEVPSNSAAVLVNSIDAAGNNNIVSLPLE